MGARKIAVRFFLMCGLIVAALSLAAFAYADNPSQGPYEAPSSADQSISSQCPKEDSQHTYSCQWTKAGATKTVWTGQTLTQPKCVMNQPCTEKKDSTTIEGKCTKSSFCNGTGGTVVGSNGQATPLQPTQLPTNSSQWESPGYTAPGYYDNSSKAFDQQGSAAPIRTYGPYDAGNPNGVIQQTFNNTGTFNTGFENNLPSSPSDLVNFELGQLAGQSLISDITGGIGGFLSGLDNSFPTDFNFETAGSAPAPVDTSGLSAPVDNSGWGITGPVQYAPNDVNSPGIYNPNAAPSNTTGFTSAVDKNPTNEDIAAQKSIQAYFGNTLPSNVFAQGTLSFNNTGNAIWNQTGITLSGSDILSPASASAQSEYAWYDPRGWFISPAYAPTLSGGETLAQGTEASPVAGADVGANLPGTPVIPAVVSPVQTVDQVDTGQSLTSASAQSEYAWYDPRGWFISPAYAPTLTGNETLAQGTEAPPAPGADAGTIPAGTPVMSSVVSPPVEVQTGANSGNGGVGGEINAPLTGGAVDERTQPADATVGVVGKEAPSNWSDYLSEKVASAWDYTKTTAQGVGDYLFGGPEGSSQSGVLSPTTAANATEQGASPAAPAAPVEEDNTIPGNAKPVQYVAPTPAASPGQLSADLTSRPSVPAEPQQVAQPVAAPAQTVQTQSILPTAAPNPGALSAQLTTRPDVTANALTPQVRQVVQPINIFPQLPVPVWTPAPTYITYAPPAASPTTPTTGPNLPTQYGPIATCLPNQNCVNFTPRYQPGPLTPPSATTTAAVNASTNQTISNTNPISNAANTLSNIVLSLLRAIGVVKDNPQMGNPSPAVGAIVTLVANPQSVPPAGASQLLWTSQGTRSCTVYDGTGSNIAAGGSDGSVTVGDIRATEQFTIRCVAANRGLVSNQATVFVQ